MPMMPLDGWKKHSMDNRKSHAIEKGFTLIEVLVALAVIALSLAAFSNATMSASNKASWMNDKTFAHWVAANKMAELQLADKWPDTGTKTGETELAGRAWQWESTIQKTEEKDMRRVDIRVRKPEDDKETNLILLSGFIANHQTPQNNTLGN